MELLLAQDFVQAPFLVRQLFLSLVSVDNGMNTQSQMQDLPLANTLRNITMILNH